MKDKIVVITGGSSGIGKVTATELAKQGATVLLISRNEERGQQALAEIKSLSGNPEVYFFACDLGSMADTRQVAQKIQAKYPKIDVLINNAGILPGKFSRTSEGIEVCWATNYLSGFLLTNLLLEQLQKAPAARIINVSSEAHRLGQIDFTKHNSPRHYSSFTAYCDSKLANILFTYELGQRLELTNITVNCLHPGVIASNFGSTSFGLLKWLFQLARPFMQTPEKGAETIIYLATDLAAGSISGHYFKNKKPVKSGKETYNTTQAKRLWRHSEEQTGIFAQPEPEENKPV